VTDIFEETEETLRAEKWIGIAKKSAPWVGGVLGGALVLSLGVWGLQSYNQSVVYKTSETYQAGVEALEANDNATARTKFTEVTKKGPNNYRALAYMQLSGLDLTDKKIDAAITDLQQSAKASNDPVIHDLAALKLAYLKMDKAPFSEVEALLKPLMGEKRPFIYQAKEALAMAKLQAGDSKGARADLNILSVTYGAPDGIKAAAAARVNAIDSGSDVVAREIMKLPEPPAATIDPSQLGQGIVAQ
jgi:hypothetical protein